MTHRTQPSGEQRGARRALQHPRGDEGGGSRGDRGAHAREREQQHADEVRATAPVLVSDDSSDQQQRGQAEDEAVRIHAGPVTPARRSAAVTGSVTAGTV